MSQEYKPATEREKDRLRQDNETIVVSTSPGGGNKTLHLRRSEQEPLCTQATSYNPQSTPANFVDKPLACFPRGWCPWCKHCLEVWRRDADMV